MKPSIMIDIETLGTRPGCVISSIGACVFDLHGTFTNPTLHLHVSLDDSERHGFRIEADTVVWWIGQSPEARNALIDGQRTHMNGSPTTYSAENAVAALSLFVRSVEGEPWIWCNGASFDFPILAAYFARFNRPLPWNRWQEMDLRTLKNLNKGLRLERQGTHHNALDDAIHQARLVQHILQANPDMDS